MRSVLCPVIVGRAAQLTALCDGLDAAAAGHGSVLLVIGEPGVGKTRLLRELRRRASERGIAALVGRAVESSVPLPYRPIGEALLAACRSNRVGDDPDVAPFRAALGRLVPEWSVSDTSGSDVSLLHVAEGFLRVARSRGGSRGGVVVLDDLQWADGESLAVLEYLADNVRDEPVLVVVAARSDPASESVGALMALVDRRVASALELSRLTTEQAIEMTRHCLGDARIPAEVLQLVIDRADGVPFFVEELLAALENDGALLRHGDRWVAERLAVRVPTTFAESVRRRFGLLAPRAREILLDAALLGRRIDPLLLGTVQGADLVVVGEVLRAAERRLLVEVHDSGFRFRNALTRDALLNELPPGDRAARARKVLDGVEIMSSEVVSEHPEVIADLAEAAERHNVAVEQLLEVGRRALRQGALTSAESVQRRALVLAKGSDLELHATEALVETLGLAGRADDTFPLGEVLLARFDSSAAALDPHGARRYAVHLALGRAAVAGTDWALAGAHLQAARRYRTGQEPAQLHTLEAVVALGEGHLAEAGRLASAAVAAAEAAGVSDLLCEALLVHGRCARIRDHDVAERAFERARVVAHEAGLVHREARALAELGSVDAYRGLETRLQESRRLAEACGAPETEAVAENHLAVAAWTRGDVDAILGHAEAVLQLARRYHLGLLVPAALIHQACAHAMRGDSAVVEALVQQAAPQITQEATQRISMHAHVRAVCALANDDLATAARELTTAEDIVRCARPTAVPPLVSMAVLVRALNGVDLQQAVTELRRRTCGGPLFDAVLAAAEAVAVGRRGDHAAATSAMGSALLDLEFNPFVRAAVARLVGPRAMADGWGEPREWLEAALATFEARGLSRPADACRAALRHYGPLGRRDPAGITSRERDVLDLVAEGLPNRAIAERLFLSPRTVEKHVERLLAKTGSNNRAQLATYVLRCDANT